MKIERKNLKNSITELIIEEDAKTVAKSRKKAIENISKNAEIKGFRKGTQIPENIIVKQYGEEYINKMTIDFAIDTIYKQALKKEKIIPVAQAEIKEIISESPLKIKVHIEVLPEVEIDKKYKKIKLKKVPVKVDTSEVKKALEEIETKFTKFEIDETKKKKAKMGDRVTINTWGFEGKKELENTNMQEYPIVLGTNILVPGFEECIVGAKTGDKLEFPVNFPKDYHNKDFANKKTTFKVEVVKLETAKKPEFTPEFIEQLRGKKLDLKGFKELIKSEILDVKQANARNDEEQKLIDELLKITKIEIGEGLTKNKIEQVFSEIKNDMTSRKIKMSDYLESLKMSEDEYKDKNVKPIAIKRLQGELILSKLNELEKVEVSQKDMKDEIENILKQFSSEDVLSRLKELYVPGNKHYEELKIRIIYKKLIDSFFE